MAFSVASTTLVGQSLGQKRWIKRKVCPCCAQNSAAGGDFSTVLLFIFFLTPSPASIPLMLQWRRPEPSWKILALSLPGQSTSSRWPGLYGSRGYHVSPLCFRYRDLDFSGRGRLCFRPHLPLGSHRRLGGFVMDNIRSAIVYLRFRSGKWKYVKAGSVEARQVKPLDGKSTTPVIYRVFVS